MNDFTHHTAKAAVALLGDRSLSQTISHRCTAFKTESSESIGNYKRLVVGESVKNPRKSKESSSLPLCRMLRSPQKLGQWQDLTKDRFDLAL